VPVAANQNGLITVEIAPSSAALVTVAPLTQASAGASG
jgi:hypothetical protein